MRIRQAREKDREYIMSWIKEIWSGHDYIPYVWDEWLNDPCGSLYVVDDRGKAIALWHIIWLDNTAWLEGMRVKPDYRNRGIATMTARYSIELSKEKGVKNVMLLTSSTNKPVIRIMEKIGFEIVGRYNRFKVKEFDKVDVTEKVMCNIDWDYLKRRYYRLRENNFIIGYFMRPWIFTELNKEEFDEICRNMNIYVSENCDAIAIIGKPFKRKDREVFYIRYLDGYAEEEIKYLIKKILYKASKLGYKEVYGYIPFSNELISILEKLGFDVEKEHNLIYRYKIY